MSLIITGNLELIIAKQIRQFCALLSLNKRWQFGDQESLNNQLWFGYVVSLNARWQFCNSLSLNICWWFWRPLITWTETIELVAFFGLGGVNNFFSHVSLILVATSSIFAKSLLTSFLVLVHCTRAPMFLVQNAWVSRSKTLMGTW